MAQLLTVEQPCRLELDCPPGVHVRGPASLGLLKYLFSVRGKSVLDVGCGPGLFAIAAARLGAREAWATDASSTAVDCARRNATRNGAEVTVKVGDFFEPVADRTFDLIIADPPQMPAPAGARGPEFAGADGLRWFETLVREAPEHLERGGELLTFVVSFAETRRFEAMLSERFRFRALPTTRRDVPRTDLDALHPDLARLLADRRERGLAEFDDSDGALVATVRTYLAMRL